jgi:NAD(P)-dependent dehydrogenase (short-subunit alcohol dehydrogenase family)
VDDLHCRQRPYDPLEAYGQSKTADSLFALEFDRRYADRGVRAFAIFPGGIATPLLRHMNDELYEQMGVVPVDKRPPGALKTPEEGAATTIWAAVAPELCGRGGLHASDCAIVGVGDAAGPLPYAADPASAKRLWWMTEREVGLASDTP